MPAWGAVRPIEMWAGLFARWADAGTATRALNIHSLDRTLIKQSKVHYYLIKFFIGSLIGPLVAP